MRTVTGNTTVSLQLRVSFEKEISQYARKLSEYLSASGVKSVFGSEIKTELPKSNIQEITDKYIRLAKQELISKGVRTVRANTVSKYVIESLLEETMLELEKAH